jgi:hypothetical protein
MLFKITVPTSQRTQSLSCDHASVEMSTEVFLTLTEVFPCFFLSCKANASVKLAKTGHGPHSTTLVSICVVRTLLFVLLNCYLCCSIYCLCVNVYCHRVTTQLQLINILYIMSMKSAFFGTAGSVDW